MIRIYRVACDGIPQEVIASGAILAPRVPISLRYNETHIAAVMSSIADDVVACIRRCRQDEKFLIRVTANHSLCAPGREDEAKTHVPVNRCHTACAMIQA